MLRCTRVRRAVPGGSRDPSDDMILATAIESGADYIVSGDKDLLTLESYDQVRIIRPAEFVTVLADQRSL